MVSEKNNNAAADGGGVRRRGCSFSKGDFLPEESFKTWGSYGKALKDTPSRFINRVTTRSLDSSELEAKARSGNQMKKTLTWWDLIWFGMGAVIGAEIFVLTGFEAKEDAGPAVVLSFVVSGISAMLYVFCYTEFAVEIPVAGGSFAYLRVELGDFMAFIAAGNILLMYVFEGASVARSWTSYFATLCNYHPNRFRIHATSLAEGYNYLDPVAIGILIIVGIIAVVSTKVSSRLNYIASIVHMVVILFIIIAGLAKADVKNYTPFTPYGTRGIIKASNVLFFAYIGFDAVATMAEETKNPGKDIPIGLVGSMVITTTLYCLLAITLCLMVPFKSIDPDAPFSVAFETVGWSWAKYIVAAGALKGVTSVLLVGTVGQARYLTHIARTHMMPPWFAQVDAKTGTPMNATVSMIVATSIIAFFTKLDILDNLQSISTLFILMLVAIALLVRRYYVTGVTTSADRNKLIVCLALIIGSSIATAMYWGLTTEGYIGFCITVPIWLVGTAGIAFFVPHAREAKLWGVPLVPWLPSASIAINIFLLGSIDKQSFMRFGAWTGFLLVYYLLFGLHASYDTAKVYDEAGSFRKVEEGNNAPIAAAGVPRDRSPTFLPPETGLAEGSKQWCTSSVSPSLAVCESGANQVPSSGPVGVGFQATQHLMQQGTVEGTQLRKPIGSGPGVALVQPAAAIPVRGLARNARMSVGGLRRPIIVHVSSEEDADFCPPKHGRSIAKNSIGKRKLRKTAEGSSHSVTLALPASSTRSKEGKRKSHQLPELGKACRVKKVKLSSGSSYCLGSLSEDDTGKDFIPLSLRGKMLKTDLGSSGGNQFGGSPSSPE